MVLDYTAVSKTKNCYPNNAIRAVWRSKIGGRKGTGFIELQYCKRNLPRLIALNKINYWEKDSLYIDVPCALSIFLDQYFDIFKSVNKNLDVFSPEYFTLKQVIELRERILELTPIDYRILVQWLDVCIDKGYSMYFLGV